MKLVFIILAFVTVLLSCTPKDPYSVSRYYTKQEADSVTASILNYVFIAPPYTLMKDRFEPKHRQFYASQCFKFSLERYFVADDGTHYFYLVRPASRVGEARGVGGYFKMHDPYKLTGFREAFVTPELPTGDVTGRCSFLFDEMVKGDLPKYLSMKSYIQWPNEVSIYDTTAYEWVLKPGYAVGR